MTRDALAAWLTDFCRSWEELDTELYLSLFTAHAVFHETPFDPPEIGVDQLRKGWGGLREFQSERRMDAEILAVLPEACVARWRASYRNSQTGVFRELDGIFLLRFATDGRCTELIEWRHARDDGVTVPT